MDSGVVEGLNLVEPKYSPVLLKYMFAPIFMTIHSIFVYIFTNVNHMVALEERSGNH